MKKGTTRAVCFIGKYAIKFPRIYRWKTFLRALLANIDEAYWYENSPKIWKEKLCPVVRMGPGGLFLIMRKAESINEKEYDKEKFGQEFKMFPLDNKIMNFGKIDNKIVIIDYADSPYMCSDCSEVIKQCKKNIILTEVKS